MARRYTPIFDEQNPPGEIFFGHEDFLPGTTTPPHQHNWGQLQFTRGGIMELVAERQRFLAPARYAIWVPKGVIHQSYMRRSVSYCSMNITEPKALALPGSVCLLEVSPLMHAIIDELRQRLISVPEKGRESRLAQVLFDEVTHAPVQNQFLPATNDKLVAPIIRALQHNPADHRTLAQWADEIHTTERTLARHFKDSVGFSFSELKQRIRFVHAITLLRKGKSITHIALELGYHQASPFISMFKKHAGCTPDQYRNRPQP